MNTFRDKFINKIELLKGNLWRGLTIVIIIIMVVVIGRNFFHAITISGQIGDLQDEKRRFQQSITADSTLLESLKTDDGLEKFARERYHMQLPNEEIFIAK